MIIVTGTLAFDYIMEFPGEFGDHILPEHSRQVNLSFIVNKFAKRRGGTAGNTSYTLGLLKTPHILYSYAGGDFAEYKKTFDKMGIDTKHIKIDKNTNTATGFALTDKTNNQIWGYYYGASANNSKLLIKKIATKKDLVLIGPQGAEGSLSFIKQCVNLHIPYMFDPGFILTGINNNDLTLGIANSYIIIGNEYEMALINKRVPRFKKLSKNKIIITTLGEKGALITKDKNKYEIKPVKVKSVASTTGAGDAWRGGFLAGYQRGLDLLTCGQMGSVAGSYAVGHYGTQEHTYSIKQFQNTFRQIYGNLIKL